MTESDGIVIVGGGLAGAKAAEGAREAGWEGPITLIGAEPYLPYERPPLTKGLLQGGDGPEAAFVHPDGWDAEHGVELRLGVRAASIDPDAHIVTTEGGRTVPFSKLVLATGSAARRPELPGADLPEVFTVRTMSDSLALRERLRPGARLAIVGSSWIGAETAASARQRGAEVTLVGRGAELLERVLGREIGAFFSRIHREHGVDLRLGLDATAIEGGDHVTGLRLSDGSLVEVDTVVLGIGADPSTGLAEAAGLAVDHGVLADERLATSHPDVLVAGDIANAQHPVLGRRLRIEHWANALEQGLAAGRNAAGADRPYELLPFFFSDQYDTGMEYSGWPVSFDEVVFRGSPDDGEFVAFQLADGVVVGGANVNVWDVNEHVQALLRAARPVRREVLADPGVDPADWVRLAVA